MSLDDPTRIKQLVRRKCIDIDARDQNEGLTKGFTALTWASARGMTEAVMHLITAGASTAKALPIAIHFQQTETAKLLLRSTNWLLDFDIVRMDFGEGCAHAPAPRVRAWARASVCVHGLSSRRTLALVSDC